MKTTTARVAQLIVNGLGHGNIQKLLDEMQLRSTAMGEIATVCEQVAMADAALFASQEARELEAAIASFTGLLSLNDATVLAEAVPAATSATSATKPAKKTKAELAALAEVAPSKSELPDGLGKVLAAKGPEAISLVRGIHDLAALRRLHTMETRKGVVDAIAKAIRKLERSAK